MNDCFKVFGVLKWLNFRNVPKLKRAWLYDGFDVTAQVRSLLNNTPRLLHCGVKRWKNEPTVSVIWVLEKSVPNRSMLNVLETVYKRENSTEVIGVRAEVNWSVVCVKQKLMRCSSGTASVENGISSAILCPNSKVMQRNPFVRCVNNHYVKLLYLFCLLSCTSAVLQWTGSTEFFIYFTCLVLSATVWDSLGPS